MKSRATTKAIMTVVLCGLACTSDSTPPQGPQSAASVVEPVTPSAGSRPVAPEVPPIAVPEVLPPAPENPPLPPVEPAAVEPAAPTLPAVGDAKTPAAVFAASIEGGRWSVDIVDLAGLDGERLEEQLSFPDEGDDEWEGGRVALKASDGAMPAGFAVGDPWTLVTSAGAEHLRATGFGGMVSEGSGTLHFYVDLGKAPKKAKGPRLALRGHVDPAVAKLVVPKASKPADLGPKTLKRIAEAIDLGLVAAVEEEDEEFRARARAVPIHERDVKVFAGRFPGDRTHVAFVQTKPASEDDDTVVISGVLFVKADGSVELFGLAGVWGHVDPFGLIDVDGDGLHEVIYEDGYHEGWYLQMIQWAGGKPVGRTITGDGI